MKESDIIQGVYFFASPYHKTKRVLPFVIRYVSTADKDYPVQVSTVEYKGWDRTQIDTGYKSERVIEMLESGFLIPAKQVKESQVLPCDKHLLTLELFAPERMQPGVVGSVATY